MANQDRVNFVWAESALTTIPPIPVSEVAYRDTTQTPEQMEVGQQYDTIYNSARHNQLLFLLTSVAKTLCENGIMPFLAGQEYSQYARCIFTDGKLYIASRAILANEQPYPTPGDDSGVWIVEETSENLVPNSRRVIAGTGLTGGGPLSSDVTLSAKLDGKTTQADASGVITVKDVAIGGNLEDLASARGYLVDEYLPEFPSRTVLSSFDDATTPGNFHVLWNNTTTSAPDGILNKNQYADGVLEVRDNRSASFVSSFARLMQRLTIIGGATRADSARIFVRTQSWGATREWFPWVELVSYNKFGDGLTVNNGIISVPEMQGATASTSGTSGLVPPAAAGQQESFLTGGGEYKPALSTSGGTVTGNLSIKNLLDLIGTAPATEQELGLYHLDKNGNIMGGHDFVHTINNIKSAQMYARNSSGLFSSLGVCVEEDGTRYILSSHNIIITSDVEIGRLYADGVRLITFSGTKSSPGLMMRYSPDTGELYLDGRAVHGKADTAVYANSAATANTATGLTYTFTKNSSLVLPPGGTWFVLNWWDGDGGTAAGNWSGGRIVAGGSSVDVRNGAFALRVA